MKKLLLILSLFLFTVKSFSQCGVQAAVIVGPGSSMAGVNFYSSSITQPNWKIYNYEWTDNDIITSTTYGLEYTSDFNNFGISKICLKVWATDTLTGDSCSDEVCNLYLNLFDFEFANLDVVGISGNDATIRIVNLDNYWGAGNAGYTIDFGDGSPPVNGSMAGWIDLMHTYPSSGDYLVQGTTYPVMGNNWPTFSRVVHVNNGIPNITPPLSIYGSNPFCFPSNYYINTNPAYNSAGVSIPAGFYYHQATLQTVQGQQTLSGQVNIPGQHFINMVYADSNSSFNYSFSVYVDASCIPPPDTIFGTVWTDLNYNGLYDASEFPLPNATISIWNYTTKTDSSGNYSILIPHVPSSINATYSGYTKTFPVSGYYVNFPSGTGHYGFNFGMAPSTPYVCGKSFIDFNNDSVFTSATDIKMQSTTLKLHNVNTGFDYFTTTDVNGNYCINIDTGLYSIKPVNFLLDSANLIPDSIILTVNNLGYTNQDFAFSSTFSGGNFNIHINSNRQPRPGFSYSLITRIENTGIDTIIGNYVLTFDTALIFSSVIPANGILDNANHTITWSTGNVNPSSAKYFTANFTVHQFAFVGSVITCSGIIAAVPVSDDHDTTNNMTTFHQTVVGSLDPNDKSVYPNGNGNSGNIHPDARLNYRINFQNTGTASAINIIVQDTIDTDLDMNTFLMQRASHAYSLIINGNIITWKFSNINLPDSNSNETLSHGYIEYSIKPNQGLADSTTIENNAQIYFDFNSPVSTNTTLNTLCTPSIGTDIITACDSITWIDGNIYTSSTNTPVFTIIGGSATNCDSIITLDLTITHSTFATDSITACKSFTWIDGNTYTSSNNTAIYVLTNNVGCDSVVTLNLTINNVNTAVSLDSTTATLIADSGALSYQWLDCNNNYSVISGATSQSFAPAQNGIYAVAITQNGCTDTSACISVLNVGITEENSYVYFSIYPNPTNGMFSVIVNGLQQTQNKIEIYNTNSQKVFSGNISSNKINIDLSHHPDGIYLVMLKTKDESFSKKIIIQNVKGK